MATPQLSAGQSRSEEMSGDYEVYKFAANAAITLVSATASIIAYYFFGGLFSSIIASLVVLPALMGLTKLAKIEIEPLQYVALFFLIVLGLPSILLNDPFMAKIQEPISGLLMGVGFGAISWFCKEPVIKKVTPNFIKKNKFLNKHLFSASDTAWKKIDYLWAVEMTLSAALSMAAVFLFSTNIWFIAKYTIGPVLSFFSFGLTLKIMHADIAAAPLISHTITQRLLSPPQENQEVLKHGQWIIKNDYKQDHIRDEIHGDKNSDKQINDLKRASHQC